MKLNQKNQKWFVIVFIICTVLIFNTNSIYAQQTNEDEEVQDEFMQSLRDTVNGEVDEREEEIEIDEDEYIFRETLDDALPMSPDQVDEYQSHVKDTKDAIQDQPPEITERSRRIDLHPSGAAPNINIIPGHVMAMAFFDITGEPWPVSSVSVGNPNAYSVQKPELSEGNLVTIAALSEYSHSNLVVTLKGHSMPLNVQMVTDVEHGGSSEGLVAFRVEERGPNAKDPLTGPSVSKTVDEIMLDFLDFVPPDNAHYLEKTTRQSGIDAWEYNDNYYVRSKYELVWPAYTEIVRSVGEVSVYKVSQVPEIVVNHNGENRSVRIR